MRTKYTAFVLVILLDVWCSNNNAFCSEINIPADTEELRQFLLKGYSSAKSILEDARIEYETVRVPINPIPESNSLPLPEHLHITKRYGYDIWSSTTWSSTTNVYEYIQKHGKERWVLLYHKTSGQKEDLSYPSGLTGAKNSPRFRVFDGQYILDYYPVTDGFTQVGRATLSASKTSLFESFGSTVYAPVELFGYWPGLMPDNVLLSPQLKIETKPEKIGDLLTYKVTAPIQINKTKFNMVYWLSPERSCLPVKIEVKRNGKLSRRLEVKGFFELEDGRWAIKSMLKRNFIYRGGEDPIEVQNLICTMRKLELQPEIDEDKVFSTSPNSLSDGVDILDHVSGLRYFGGEGPISERSIADIMKKSLESLNEIPNVTITEAVEEATSKSTGLFEDANKPLFSNTGILASQTTQQTVQDNKVPILAVTIAGAGILAISLTAIAVFRRSAKKGGRNNG